jgi:hypothetical protein
VNFNFVRLALGLSSMVASEAESLAPEAHLISVDDALLRHDIEVNA